MIKEDEKELLPLKAEVMDDVQKRLLEELLFSGEKKLSFAKLLFFGEFHAPSVLPFPQPSEEEKARARELEGRLRAFALSEIHPSEIDHQSAIPPKVIEGLGSLGILGLTIPKAYGGLGLSQYTYCRVMAELSRHCSATALFVNAHQSVGLKALVLFGTEEQRKKWLPRLASGEQIAAFSLTEEKAGSDASAVETRAVYQPEKKSYLLNGRKQWTTNGSMASVLTVMAQTEVETPKGMQDKITAFIVTPDMPGFKVRDRALEKVGMRGSWTSNLEFDNVEVPEENILGPKGAGLKVCLTVLDYGRTTFGATCMGQARLLMQMAFSHAKNRVQFKRPLADFPLIKEKLATIASLTYAMESATWLTAGLVDRGTEEFMVEAAILKVFNSESLWTIIYETMQIYGGRSFFCSEPLERLMRDARLNMIGEGANEVLRVFIAAVGLRDVGLELQGLQEALYHPYRDNERLKAFGKRLFGHLWQADIPLQSEKLQAEGQALGKLTRRLGKAAVRLLRYYREEVIEQQLALNRLASVAISLYTGAAVLSRIDRELALTPYSDALFQDLSSAKYYCRKAFASANRELDHLFDPEDRETELYVDQLMHAWASEN